MMNDSVREELHSSVTPVSGQLPIQSQDLTTADRLSELAPPVKHIGLEPRLRDRTLEGQMPQPTTRPVQTASLPSPRTSPTLVDFQAKNTTIPEWRLQMQNAVRQRLGTMTEEASQAAETLVAGSRLDTRGRAPFKREKVQVAEPLPHLEDADPRLTAALRRIQDSRHNFLASGPKKVTVAKVVASPKQFPFNVVRTQLTRHPEARVADPVAVTAERPKPAMSAPLRMEKRLDTNKLPLIETILPASTVIVAGISEPGDIATTETTLASGRMDFAKEHRIVINAEQTDAEAQGEHGLEDEIEDLAPFSMRFNAGLFDLIIGVFLSLMLLSPIVLTGSSWMSTAAFLTFAGTLAIIMFVYTTVSVGFFGKTVGMRLFSLELVDAEENQYPTIHQAAVSSSLYILSLLLGGVGFISVFFNEEKRAVHDLLSGTIIVREF
jgi:uncharacterized RDD family membrane protein YckC